MDILSLFYSISEIITSYKQFSVLRADLMRYLILWYHGGFYTDIDT